MSEVIISDGNYTDYALGGTSISGFIEPQSLEQIKVASYYRPERDDLVNLYKRYIDEQNPAQLHGIELNVRMGRSALAAGFSKDDTTFTLHGETYLIDGRELVSVVKKIWDDRPEIAPRLGAVVFINMPVDQEEARYNVISEKWTPLTRKQMARNERLAARISQNS